MRAMTSTNTGNTSTGMPRNEATTLTVADATTTMRTGWLQSRRGLESSAERFTTHRYPTRFNPQLASPNTTMRLS